MKDWDTIARAYEMVLSGNVNRVDGDGWKVYRAGSIIRVDIEVKTL